MKTTLPVLFLLFISQILFGQNNEKQQSADDLFRKFSNDSLFRIPDIRPGFNFPRQSEVPVMPDDRGFQQPGFREIMPYDDYRLDETFPGSSRFYAKRHYLLINPGIDDFIAKPDSSARLYLIIKDPIRHTVRKY